MRATYAPGLFVGKAVAITGGGTGIGLHTARRFAALGASVSICGRRAEVLEAAARDIEAAGRAAGHATRVAQASACSTSRRASSGREPARPSAALCPLGDILAHVLRRISMILSGSCLVAKSAK